MWDEKPKRGMHPIRQYGAQIALVIIAGVFAAASFLRASQQRDEQARSVALTVTAELAQQWPTVWVITPTLPPILPPTLTPLRSIAPSSTPLPNPTIQATLEAAWNNALNAESEDASEAIDAYTVVLEHNPNHTSALYRRGLLYFAQNEWLKAKADLDRVIELDPHNVEAYYYRGLIEDQLGNPEAAYQFHDRALQFCDGNCAVNYYNRGLALYDLRTYNRAIADFERAVELQPDDGLNYFMLGMSYYSLNQYENAVKYFLEAQERGVQSPELFLVLGDSLYALGEGKDALENIRQYLDLAGDDAESFAVTRAYELEQTASTEEAGD